jgi:hypothetical protein
VLSPYTAAITTEAMNLMNVRIVEQILQLSRGERPEYVENPQVYENLYEDLLDLTAINYDTSGSSELNNRNISVEDWYWVLWKVERRSTRD